MRNTERGSRNEGSARPPYNGPRLAMSAQIYAVLKPVSRSGASSRGLCPEHAIRHGPVGCRGGADRRPR